MVEISELLENAMQIAREAGRIQIEYFRGQDLDINPKFNDSDIVTIADKESERMIISRIRDLYPDHSILSEESGADNRESDYCWVIDPLDGTTNYSQGLPLFAVSIGIVYKRETIAGVVYAPYLDEMFHAWKGGGAYLNGEVVRVSSKNSLRQSVIATGFPVDKDTNPDNNADNFNRVMPAVRGIRRLGSAAIDLCYVATGILDGYWEMNLHEWDVCAGELIALEAGAEIRRFRSDRNISVIAASPSILRQLTPLIR